MKEPFHTLISAAILAPSGDNTQPWRFEVDEDASTIKILVDESRDTSPMNAGQRMSRLAVGAALENMILAAECKSWDLEFDEPHGGAIAVVRVTHFDDNDQQVDDAIAARATNRLPYNQQPIGTAMLARLKKAAPLVEGTRTLWITDPKRLEVLADLVGDADALMFGNSLFRRAFLENVRFDRSWDDEVDEGLSIASLELPLHERLILPMLSSIPDWLFRASGAQHQFKSKARQLVKSASGVCLVVDSESSHNSGIAAGRMLQRSWLALTRLGLACQPMMSLLILKNVLCQGCEDVLGRENRKKARALVGQFHDLAPEIGNDEPSFLLRFGFAVTPNVRTQRLPISSCTTVSKMTSRIHSS